MDASVNTQHLEEGGVEKQETPTVHFLTGEKLVEKFKAWEATKVDELELAKESWDFYHGNHLTSAEKAILRRRGQPDTYYNEVRIKVDGMVGVEEGMRRDPKTYPRNPSPQNEQQADVSTKALRFCCENNDFDSLTAEVTQRGFVGGISGIEFDIDASGKQKEIVISHIGKGTFFYDPRSEKRDFSDAKFLGTFKKMDSEDVKEMFPKKLDLIDSIMTASKDGDFSGLGEAQNKDKSWAEFKEDRMMIIEHWYKIKGQWNCAHHCGNYILNEVVSPFIDDKGKTTHRYELWNPLIDEEGLRYGAVKDMLPIQRSINKRASKLLHMMNTRQTIGEEGAVKDVAKAKRELHKPNGHVTVNPGMKFEIVRNDDQAAGQMQLLQHDHSRMDRMGANNALIGRGTEGDSGVSLREQKQSGLAEMSPELQELRSWKIRSYRKMWNMIRQFWTEERFILITDEKDAAQFMPLNQIVFDEESGEYRIENNIQDMDIGIILDEGPDTITAQQDSFKTMLELMPLMRDTGQPIPAQAIFEASPLRNKDKIIEMIKESEQKSAQQAQQQMQAQQRQQELAGKEIELKMQEIAAGISETMSKTELNKARAFKEMQAADVLDDRDLNNSIPLGPAVDQGRYRDSDIVHPDQLPQEFYP